MRPLFPIAGAVLLLTAAAGRADEALTLARFQPQPPDPKAFAARLTVAVIQAAHPTGRNPTFTRFELSLPRKNRAALKLYGSYEGALSGNVYTVEATVLADSADLATLEILSIDFKDLNNRLFKPSAANLAELVKRMNRFLDRLRRQTEAEFVAELAADAVALAHPTARAPKVEKYAVDRTTPGRLVLTAAVTYTGFATGRTYHADVVARVDTARPRWALTAVEFTDRDNAIPANTAALAKLVRRINGG